MRRGGFRGFPGTRQGTRAGLSFIRSILSRRSFFSSLSGKRSSKRFDERLTYERYRCADLVIYIKLYCLPSVETWLIVSQGDNRICRCCRNSRSALDPSPCSTPFLPPRRPAAPPACRRAAICNLIKIPRAAYIFFFVPKRNSASVARRSDLCEKRTRKRTSPS